MGRKSSPLSFFFKILCGYRFAFIIVFSATVVNRSDDSVWIAHGHAVRKNIFDNYATCADNGVFTDGHAGTDDGSGVCLMKMNIQNVLCGQAPNSILYNPFRMVERIIILF